MNEMNITLAQYVANPESENCAIKATIDGEDMFVPLAPGNRHYAEIMRQQSEGLLTIADAD